MERVMKKIWVLFFSISTVMDLLISMSEVEEVNSGRDRNTTATGSILEMAKGGSPYRAEFCQTSGPVPLWGSQRISIEMDRKSYFLDRVSRLRSIRWHPQAISCNAETTHVLISTITFL